VNAEEYLNAALGGNMNISTLKPIAWHEIMEGYAKTKRMEHVAELVDIAEGFQESAAENDIELFEDSLQRLWNIVEP